MQMIELPKQAVLALELLESGGWEAFVVGGCVRDFLLGKSPDDIDITTNADPLTVMEIFSAYKVLETGLKHGTVTVIIESMAFEITTYRVDGDYTDNRRPDRVFYTQSIEEDLARRDFTMNAIAYNPARGFVDPFGGQMDISHKIIRAVGEAKKRFDEDALRILRGLRFSSALGFNIDSSTFDAMNEKKELLLSISSERIYTELCKTLLGVMAPQSLDSSVHICGVVIPEILPMVGFDQKNPHHIFDVFTHSLKALSNVPPVLHLRLAAFFHDIGKPSVFSTDDNGIGHFYGHGESGVLITKAVLTRLKCDNDTKDKVITLIQYHDVIIEPSKKQIKRLLQKLSPELFLDLLTLKRADNLAQNPKYRYRQKELNTVEALAAEIISAEECFNIKSLDINGRDLMAIGLQGKEIGDALNLLVEAVIDGKVDNSKLLLIQWVKNH